MSSRLGSRRVPRASSMLTPALGTGPAAPMTLLSCGFNRSGRSYGVVTAAGRVGT